MPLVLIFARKFLRHMSIAVVLTTLLSAAGIVAVNDMINSRFDNLKRQDVNVAEDTGASEPANFLLIGSDSRSELTSDEEQSEFGSEESGQRSDTMMIIHVEPRTKKTTVLAIPRDTLVNIPGIGKQKINASFNQDLGGGPDKVVETIQANFNIPIQHYVELDFKSFQQIVTAVGGVNVYFPTPARDRKLQWHTYGKSGCIKLDGAQALSYVRSRYYEQYIDGRWQADPTSNYGRIARQQAFMRRVATIAVRKSLTDPLKGRDVADAVISNLQVDQNLKKDDIFKLMNAFNGVDPNDPEYVRFEMLPVKSAMQNGQSVDLVQTAEAEPLLEIFRNFSNLDSSGETEETLPNASTVQIRVLNATGRKGLAATAMASFQEAGFVAAGTGNATSRNTTEIHYSPGNKSQALLVSKYVKATLIQDSTIADADVVVILGNDFTQVNVSGKETTTSTSATTQPTSSTQPEPSINGVAEGVDCPA